MSPPMSTDGCSRCANFLHSTHLHTHHWSACGPKLHTNWTIPYGYFTLFLTVSVDIQKSFQFPKEEFLDWTHPHPRRAGFNLVPSGCCSSSSRLVNDTVEHDFSITGPEFRDLVHSIIHKVNRTSCLCIAP